MYKTMQILQSLLIIVSIANAAITDCSKGKSLFSIQGLGFWPDPAVKNENSSVSFAYTVPEPGITAGSVKYSVTYNFIPLSPTLDDLCSQVVCPLLPGSYNQTTSSVFPDLSGSVTVTIEWRDVSGSQLLCAQIKTKVT